MSNWLHQQIDILLIGFSTYCQLTKTQKAEKYKSHLLLEYNLVLNCSAILAFFSFFKLFLLFPGPMMTSFFKVDTELFLLIAFRLFQGFSGLHKPKKAKCHTSDASLEPIELVSKCDCQQLSLCQRGIAGIALQESSDIPRRSLIPTVRFLMVLCGGRHVAKDPGLSLPRLDPNPDRF